MRICEIYVGLTSVRTTYWRPPIHYDNLVTRGSQLVRNVIVERRGPHFSDSFLIREVVRILLFSVIFMFKVKLLKDQNQLKRGVTTEDPLIWDLMVFSTSFEEMEKGARVKEHFGPFQNLPHLIWELIIYLQVFVHFTNLVLLSLQPVKNVTKERRGLNFSDNFPIRVVDWRSLRPPISMTLVGNFY